MRKWSPNRPNEKVRNPNRHIKAIENWASNFEGFYPVRSDERYENFKIWTLDRLVQGPKSKYEWKQSALKQLVIAANHLVAAKPASEKNKSWVAILLSYPNLWSSEITVFFDQEYYENFIPMTIDTSLESVITKYRIELPCDYSETGYKVSWDDEDEGGKLYTVSEVRWTIGEKIL